MDIVCLGEVLIDMFPAETGRELIAVSAFRPVPGGAPANVAVAAARLGARSAFIGKVGEDPFGHLLEGVLRREEVDTRGVRFDIRARTTLVFIALPTAQTAEFLFYRNPGADMLLEPGELEEGVLREAGALHFGSISLIQEPSRSATLRAIHLARDAGALVSFDVNYRPTLWESADAAREAIGAVLPLVHLVKVNEVELALLAGGDGLAEPVRRILRGGPSLCVVTLGPEGCFYGAEGIEERVPGFSVDVVDATGCGDAFVAGLLCRLVSVDGWQRKISRDGLHAAARYANAAGALTARRQGVMPALPSAAEVAAFLGGHPA